MAVVGDGQPIAPTVAGVRNSVDGTPVDPQTIFAAASLSKPVFAYAVLRLIEAGTLSLDTALSRHVPDYVSGDSRAAAITVQQVLSHTSGLPNWRAADVPLGTGFAPGERFGYSGEGFVWLQKVVEAVTGEPLDTTLRRLVFEPLAMHRSSYVWQPAFDSNYADPHDGDMAPGGLIKPSQPNAAASLLTTSDDYARFLEAVLSGAHLRRDTACQWFEPQIHLSDTQVAWGLGWGLEPRSGTFFQWGDNDRGRFKAFAMGSARLRRAIVVLTNGFNGMALMPALIGQSLPGRHPAFSWLGYPALEALRSSFGGQAPARQS